MKTLKLSGTYVDTVGQTVVMIQEYEPGCADYDIGFRFRGDNGVSYTETGGVAVNPSEHSTITTMGAHAIDLDTQAEMVDAMLGEPLLLEIGRMYRNGLGQVLLISDFVSETSRWYGKGARYIDCRGTYYTTEGWTSDNMIFKTLNLVEAVDPCEVTDEEMAQIHAWSEARIRQLDRHDTMLKVIAPLRRLGRVVSQHPGKVLAGFMAGAVVAMAKD